MPNWNQSKNSSLCLWASLLILTAVVLLGSELAPACRPWSALAPCPASISLLTPQCNCADRTELYLDKSLLY